MPLAKWMQRQLAADVMREQLVEAERQAVEHQASAEHHQALADMYKRRAVRLRTDLRPTEATVKELHHGGQLVDAKAMAR